MSWLLRLFKVGSLWITIQCVLSSPVLSPIANSSTLMKAPAGYDNDLGTASLCKELSSTYASFPSISFSSWWILRPCSHAWLRTDARSTNDVDCFYYFKHWPGCRNCFAMETISNLSFVLHEHRAGCRLPPALLLSRRNQSPDAVRSRNPSKSTLAHDAVAAAVSHKLHSIIRVGAGLIQFVSSEKYTRYTVVS